MTNEQFFLKAVEEQEKRFSALPDTEKKRQAHDFLIDIGVLDKNGVPKKQIVNGGYLCR